MKVDNRLSRADLKRVVAAYLKDANVKVLSRTVPRRGYVISG